MDIEFYESIERLDELIHKDDDGNNLIKRLNSYLVGDKKKHNFGIFVLHVVLKNCDNEVYEEHVRSWMRILMQTLNSMPSEDMLKLCFMCLVRILEMSRRIDNVSRDISGKGMEPLLSLLLGRSFPPSVEKLFILRCCMTTYSGPCGKYRPVIKKLLISALESIHEPLFCTAAELLPLLTICGSGGKEKEKFVDNWKVQICSVFNSAYYYIDQLKSDIGDEDDSKLVNDELQNTNIIEFSDITEKIEIDLKTITMRLQRLLLVLLNFMNAPMPFLIPFPTARLMDLYCKLSNFLHIDLAETRHVNLNTPLSDITQSMLECITLTVKQLSTSLTPFCQLLYNIFKSACSSPYLKSRRPLYQCVIAIIEELKSLPSYLDFPSILLEFVFNDVKVGDHFEDRGTDGSMEGGVEKGNHVTVTLRHHSQENTFHALRLLEKIIIYGALLPKRDVNSIVVNVRDIILKLLRRTFAPPYHRVDTRLMVYKSCYALLNLQHRYLQMPASCLLRFLRFGTEEPEDSIRWYCHEVLLNYDCVTHRMNNGFTELSVCGSSDIIEEDNGYQNFQVAEDANEGETTFEASYHTDHKLVKTESESTYESYSIVSPKADCVVPSKVVPSQEVPTQVVPVSCISTSPLTSPSLSQPQSSIISPLTSSLFQPPSSATSPLTSPSLSQPQSSTTSPLNSPSLFQPPGSNQPVMDPVLISDSSEEDSELTGVLPKRAKIMDNSDGNNDKRNSNSDVEEILEMFCEYDAD